MLVANVFFLTCWYRECDINAYSIWQHGLFGEQLLKLSLQSGLLYV